MYIATVQHAAICKFTLIWALSTALSINHSFIIQLLDGAAIQHFTLCALTWIRVFSTSSAIHIPHYIITFIRLPYRVLPLCKFTCIGAQLHLQCYYSALINASFLIVHYMIASNYLH